MQLQPLFGLKFHPDLPSGIAGARDWPLKAILLDQAERRLTELKASSNGMLRTGVTMIQMCTKVGYSLRLQLQRNLAHLLNVLPLLGNEKRVCESSRNRQRQTQKEVAGCLGGDRCGDEHVSFAYDQTGCMNFSLANRSASAPA
jgi:hypothetical protein